MFVVFQFFLSPLKKTLDKFYIYSFLRLLRLNQARFWANLDFIYDS